MANENRERWLGLARRGTVLPHDEVRRMALRALNTLGYALEALEFEDLADAIFNALGNMIDHLTNDEPLDLEVQEQLLQVIKKELRDNEQR